MPIHWFSRPPLVIYGLYLTAFVTIPYIPAYLNLLWEAGLTDKNPESSPPPKVTQEISPKAHWRSAQLEA